MVRRLIKVSQKDDCLIVIPAYNESLTIEKVVNSVNRVGYRNVLVINDASTDDTAEKAVLAGAIVISLAERLGAWCASQTGLRFAIRKGFSTVVTMDADDQHPARAIDTLVSTLRSADTNVVIGSCPQRGSGLRQVAWQWIRGASGVQLKDLTSGFRAYDRLAIRRAAGWRGTLLEYQDVGVLLLLQRHNLKITDVPVEMRQRYAGKSRIFYNWGVVAYYMAHTLILSASKRIGFRPYAGPTVATKVFQ
jgi:glycosyltransferase involved in cell wall biosynthesis